MKAFVKILAGLLLLTLISSATFYWYVSAKWKKYYWEAEIKEMASEIEKTPPLNPLFYSIFDKLNGNSRHRSIFAVYFRSVPTFGKSIGPSWHAEAAYYLQKIKGSHPSFTLSFALEKYTTSEKCFEFAMTQNFNKTNKRYFNLPQDISELNDTNKILTYLTVVRRPAYYYHRDNELAVSINELKNKLN